MIPPNPFTMELPTGMSHRPPSERTMRTAAAVRALQLPDSLVVYKIKVDVRVESHFLSVHTIVFLFYNLTIPEVYIHYISLIC